MKPILRSTLRSAILTTSILSCLAGAARAATFNWNVGGASDNWNTSEANWTGTGSTWVNGANEAVFGGTDGEAITIDVAGVTARQITFSNSGTAYSLSGGTIKIDRQSAADPLLDAQVNATIGSNLLINPAQTWRVASGKTLTVGGTINAVSANTNIGLSGQGAYLINGSIGGFVGNVLFNGAAGANTTVTFASANTFTGTLHLGQGGNSSTLNFSNVNQLGAGTAGNYIAIQNGSILNFTGAGNQSQTNRQIYWNIGAATIGVTDANANLTLGSTAGATRSQNFTKIGAGTLTLDSTTPISGGTVTVSGGTLVLQAANTSTGATTIKNGTLLLSGGDNRLASGTTVTIGDISTTGKLVLGDGIAKSDLTIAGLATTGIGGSVTGGNGSVSALTVNTASSNVFAGVLGGGGTLENNLSLTKNGAGTLTLSGASTFTGPTTINAGRLNVTGSLSASDVSLDGGSIGGEGSVKSITFNGGGLAVDAQTAGTLSVSSSLTSMGIVPITFTSAPSAPGSIALIHHAGGFTGSLNDFSLSGAITRSNTVTDVAGTITLDIGTANRTWSGTEDTWQAATGTAWIEGDQAFYDYDFVSFPDPVGPKTVTLGEVLFPSSTIVTNTTGNDYTFSGIGSLAGQGTLTKNGTGTLLISTATTYTGLTTVNNGTLIVAPTYNSTGNITILGGSAVVNSGATLKFDFTNVKNGSAYPNVLLNGGGTTTLNAGSTLELYADGPAHAMNNTAILFAANGATLIGAGTVKKTGSGAIDFWNAGPGAGFTGAFDVQDGVLTFQRTLADYSGKSPMHIELNATVDVRGGGLLAMVDTLTGTGIVSSSANAGNILSIGNNGGSATFDGVITDGANVGTRNGKAGTWSGTLALVKNGAGTQTLTAANSYSGTTTVANGTLLLNNTTGSGTGTGGVTVQSGGTLGGTGSISGTVSAAGALAPGSSGTGTLTTGAITLTGTYQCQLDGPNCDQLAITGALTVGSGAAITISTLATPSAASYTILSYGSLSGTLPAITPPSGYQVVHDTTAKQLKLVKSSGYSSWAATNAPTGTPSDDYDGDGVSNALEWILGGLASTNDQSKLPSVSTSGGNLVFAFVRNDAAWQSGDTSTQIQVGTNLATWPNVYNVGIDTAASSAGVTVTDNGSTDTVTLTVPIGADTKKFARLKATVTTTP